jgi:hypothetical protein
MSVKSHINSLLSDTEFFYKHFLKKFILTIHFEIITQKF